MTSYGMEIQNFLMSLITQGKSFALGVSRHISDHTETHLTRNPHFSIKIHKTEYTNTINKIHLTKQNPKNTTQDLSKEETIKLRTNHHPSTY